MAQLSGSEDHGFTGQLVRLRLSVCPDPVLGAGSVNRGRKTVVNNTSFEAKPIPCLQISKCWVKFLLKKKKNLSKIAQE